MSQKFKLLLFLLLGLLGSNVNAVASTEFSFSPTKTIQTAIAYGQVNRIQVRGGEIMEVIGDENQYQLYWSGDYRQLFIAPKLEVGKTIELSLVLAGGEAQDIKFTVIKTSAQTIFINKDRGESNLSKSLTDTHSLKSEISAMIKAMAACKNKNGKYYIIDAKRSIFKNKQMIVNQVAAYRYLELSGAVLIVQNTSGKILQLKEQDFKSIFKDTIAISIETDLLKPRAKSRVFVMTRNNKDE